MDTPTIDNPFAGLSPLSSQFSDPEPFLAIYVLDHIIDNKSQFAKSPKQWEHGLRKIGVISTSKTGFNHEYANPSDSDNSKLGCYLAAMKLALRPEDLNRIAAMSGIGNGGLVGSVAWVKRLSKKFNKDQTEPSVMNLAFRRATDDEVIYATTWHAQNPIVISSEPDTAQAMIALVAAMDWTESRVAMAVDLLVGRQRVEVFGLLDRIGDDAELRGAIVSGAALDYLVNSGEVTIDEDGTAQRDDTSAMTRASVRKGK